MGQAQSRRALAFGSLVFSLVRSGNSLHGLGLQHRQPAQKGHRMRGAYIPRLPWCAILHPGFVHQPRHSKHHFSTLDKEGAVPDVLFVSTSARRGVYIYIYSGIYSGFGYIADWGYPFVSLLPIHGITDLLSQYHVVWHLPCKACVLGISAVCLALTGSKDKLKEAILGAMKRRNPGVPWPKISLAHVCNGKMLQDGGTSCTNGGFSRARFRTDWHIPASRCSEVAPALTAFQACQLRPTHELLVSSCFGILYILYEIGGTRHPPPVTEFLLLNGQFAACLCGLYTQPS